MSPTAKKVIYIYKKLMSPAHCSFWKEWNVSHIYQKLSGSPVCRWFCEGRELQNSPDIQICREGDLHTLVIAEAFEDDTGRYTCVASNSLGADNTSAEVYIEGQAFKLLLLYKLTIAGRRFYIQSL